MGIFKTGLNPFDKRDYIVATADGSRIICHMSRADFQSDDEMERAARIIEERVSLALDCQPVIDA